MIRAKSYRGARGATHPGFLDVVIITALTAVLFYAAWRQFPAYRAAAPSTPAVEPAH